MTRNQDYCSMFVETETSVPLLDGSTTRYINFDNAASTPPLKAVQQAVDDFLPYYSSVHSGTGYEIPAFDPYVRGSPADHTEVCRRR